MRSAIHLGLYGAPVLVWAWAPSIYVYRMVVLGHVAFSTRAAIHLGLSGAAVLMWARAASISVYQMVWLPRVDSAASTPEHTV